MSAAAEIQRRLADPVIWSDVENGAYAADLELWEELAAAGGPTLELGCGSGRVALWLAGRGHDVVAVDVVGELVAAVAQRAREGGLSVDTIVADIRELECPERVAVVLAPMHVVQLLETGADRLAALERVSALLSPGGLAAFVILDEAVSREEVFEADPTDLVADIREHDGWVYSSQPIALRATPGGIEVERRRQIVSPVGDVAEEASFDRLTDLSPETLEAEAASVGLEPAGRRAIAMTETHVGSTVVLSRSRS